MLFLKLKFILLFFQDPSTAFAYHLVYTHNIIHWYLLIVLGLLYYAIMYSFIKNYYNRGHRSILATSALGAGVVSSSKIVTKKVLHKSNEELTSSCLPQQEVVVWSLPSKDMTMELVTSSCVLSNFIYWVNNYLFWGFNNFLLYKASPYMPLTNWLCDSIIHDAMKSGRVLSRLEYVTSWLLLRFDPQAAVENPNTSYFYYIRNVDFVSIWFSGLVTCGILGFIFYFSGPVGIMGFLVNNGVYWGLSSYIPGVTDYWSYWLLAKGVSISCGVGTVLTYNYLYHNLYVIPTTSPSKAVMEQKGSSFGEAGSSILG